MPIRRLASPGNRPLFRSKWSLRQPLLTDQLQADDFWRIRCFLKVAGHGFANIYAPCFDGLRLGMNAEAVNPPSAVFSVTAKITSLIAFRYRLALPPRVTFNCCWPYHTLCNSRPPSRTVNLTSVFSGN